MSCFSSGPERTCSTAQSHAPYAPPKLSPACHPAASQAPSGPAEPKPPSLWPAPASAQGPRSPHGRTRAWLGAGRDLPRLPAAGFARPKVDLEQLSVGPPPHGVDAGPLPMNLPSTRTSPAGQRQEADRKAEHPVCLQPPFQIHLSHTSQHHNPSHALVARDRDRECGRKAAGAGSEQGRPIYGQQGVTSLPAFPAHQEFALDRAPDCPTSGTSLLVRK
jgi:hypothetical protein